MYPEAGRGWYCFRCDRGGSVYDLAALLCRLTTESATVIAHNAPPRETDMSATTATETLTYHRTGTKMSTINYHQTTTSTPEQLVAGLTDFGPGREKLFGKSADSYLMVHDQGPHEADVTEGSGGVWEHLHYDWSDPTRVVLTVTDSNVWSGHSGYVYTVTRRPNDTTDVDVVNVRGGKNLKGRMLALVLGTVGKRVLVKEFAKTVKAIEARHYGASPADSQIPAMGLVC